MTRKEWVAVAVVIGGGILFQIPRHDDAMINIEGMNHSEMPAELAEVEGPYERVALDVTGMT